ncbi:MAG: acyl carrier protein [Elusimicrobia bacterium GWA2_69_24]|nr:MAG: acyl carrier protein [Elusimicrobia bacterium GWA2_69_24]HBL17443.1 acyl carrier protein [Elusimicrobiota bacterium]
MSDLAALEAELKVLIVESLGLEDVRPEDIASEAPLFGKGLGLDSIDALELALAVKKKYRIALDNKTPGYEAHFASVRRIAEFVEANRPPQ